MSYEVKKNRTLLESLAMRQRELTESNAKILDWAIKKVSNKKKIKAQKDKTPKTSGKKELTLVEEVEEYLRMEAVKERAGRYKK